MNFLPARSLVAAGVEMMIRCTHCTLDLTRFNTDPVRLLRGRETDSSHSQPGKVTWVTDKRNEGLIILTPPVSSLAAL